MNFSPGKHPFYQPYACQGGYEDSARKRQRRHTAGAFMQTLFKSGGKKSSAKPRPMILIEPRAIGPVRELNPNDVLCGRGGRINCHPGNVQFRDLVHSSKKDYISKATKKLEKAHIAADIVYEIRSRNPPGRFLKEDPDGAWFDIGDHKAIKKVGQALREDAPDFRPTDTASAGEASACKSASVSVEPAAQHAERARVIALPVSSSPQRIKRAVTVSGRGAKKISTSIDPRKSAPDNSYQPLAYQEIVPHPSYQTSILSESTPPRQFYQGNVEPLRGMLPRGGASSVSGAAAAAMQEEEEQHHDTPEEAFGRLFHPATPVNAPREASQLGPSDLLSGIPPLESQKESSLLSELSNVSDSSPNGNRQRSFHQLQQLRHQWATQRQQSASTVNPKKTPVMPSHPAAPALDRSMSFPVSHSMTMPDTFATRDAGQNLDRSMSMPAGYSGANDGNFGTSDHSLLESGLSNLPWSTSAEHYDIVEREGIPTPVSLRRGFRNRSVANSTMQRTGGHDSYQPGYLSHNAGGGPHMNAEGSVNSMSGQSNSESLPSMPGSILSDLSESLIALDLAETKPRDQV
jgi:hypothetical protein